MVSMASMAVCRTAGRGSKPRGAAKLSMPRALGPQPSLTRKGGSVQFTDEVPRGMLKGKRVTFAR